MTQSGATTPGQSGPGRDVNEGALRIPRSSSITGTLPLNCLVLYIGHSLGRVLLPCRDAVGVYPLLQPTGSQDTRWWRSYPSVEMHSVYCTPRPDWASLPLNLFFTSFLNSLIAYLNVSSLSSQKLYLSFFSISSVYQIIIPFYRRFHTNVSRWSFAGIYRQQISSCFQDSSKYSGRS